MKRTATVFLIFTVLIISLFVIFEDLETYFESLLTSVQDNTLQYAIVSFLVLTLDILLPVPSSIVMHLNGLFLDTLNGTLLSLLSVMVASVLGYYLGKLTSLAARDAKATEGNALINKYGPYALIMSRGVPVLAESVTLICGYTRWDFKYFMALSFLGYVPVCLIYAYFGSTSSNLFLIAFSATIAVSAVFWFVGTQLLNGRSAVRS